MLRGFLKEEGFAAVEICGLGGDQVVHSLLTVARGIINIYLHTRACSQPDLGTRDHRLFLVACNE